MARIVFDLDGTLIDSAPDLQAVANGILRAEGRAPISLAEARSFIGQGAPVFVRRMREARGLPEQAQATILERFMAAYAHAVDKTLVYPGVEAALDQLAAAGHRLGICTNKPLLPCHAVLKYLGLDRYFDVVIGGDSLPRHKPDPAPLQAAFTSMGEGRALYIGDSEIDAETARRASVPFLFFTEGYCKSDPETVPRYAAFSRFRDLPPLVEQMLRKAA